MDAHAGAISPIAIGTLMRVKTLGACAVVLLIACTPLVCSFVLKLSTHCCSFPLCFSPSLRA